MAMDVDFCEIDDYEILDGALDEGLARYIMQDGWGWEFLISHIELKKLHYNEYAFTKKGPSELMVFCVNNPDKPPGNDWSSDDEDIITKIKNQSNNQFNQLIQSFHQLIQSLNQSINHSINHSINKEPVQKQKQEQEQTKEQEPEKKQDKNYFNKLFFIIPVLCNLFFSFSF
jgi:hypothetical protein